jgi:hypothetical protein
MQTSFASKNAFFIGADPEVFVGRNGQVKSIVGLIGGTKAHPRPIEALGDGFAVQEDNVALEFNIPASPTKELFVANIASATEFLENAVRDMHNLQFVKESAVSFPEAELMSAEARMFGCDPDFNAWSGRKNKPPKAEDPNLRSCGGHVHIGIKGTKYDGLNIRSIIKFCDLYMGIPSIFMDKGELRKQLYGKAGAFRPKSYGGEYRSLSNYWIFEKRLTEWVYENTERALDAVLYETSLDEDARLIQTAINSSNKDIASHLVKKHNLSVI